MNPPPTNEPVAPKPAPTAAIVPHTDNEDSSNALNAFGSAANFSHAQRMAKLLSCSSMVPKQYQGEDGMPNCIIALELAARIGASVFQVMQNLHIIHGKPGWSGTFLIATVNASRRFTPLRFRWEGTRGTDGYGCRAVAKDRETGEECVGALIDVAMAKAEGWSTKPGSKWLTMGDQMHMYRAAAFWTRVYAPELSLGMQTEDEVRDTVGYEVSSAGGGAYGSLPSGVGTKALEDALRNAPPATIVVQKSDAQTVSQHQDVAPATSGSDQSGISSDVHPVIADFQLAIAKAPSTIELTRIMRGINDAVKAKRFPGALSADLFERITAREKALKLDADSEPPANVRTTE